MSEATVKALTDAIYDAYQDSRLLYELDNEQVYEVARLAAQTIESAGTTKAIIRAWLEGDGRFVKVEPYERDKDGHWEHNGDIHTWVLDPPTRFRIVEGPTQ